MKIFARLIIILMTLSSMRQVTPAAAGGGGSSPAARTDGAIGINEAADSLTQDMVLNLRRIPAGNPILSQQDHLKNIVLSIMEKLATLYPTLPHLIILSDVSTNLTKAGRSAENWIDPRYLFCVKKMLTKVTTAYKGERVTDNKVWLPEELNALLDRYIGEEAASIEAMAFPAAPLAVTLSRSVSTATLGGGAASGGGSSSPATAVAVLGGAGAPASLAVAAPSGRIVATSAIVREMFDHPYEDVAMVSDNPDHSTLSPLECALRITSLDFNNEAVINEMIEIINRNMKGARNSFFTRLNLLLNAVDYNNNDSLKTIMLRALDDNERTAGMMADALRGAVKMGSLLNAYVRDGGEATQNVVIERLKKKGLLISSSDTLEISLSGHEFCSLFPSESPAQSLMRIKILGKFIAFIPDTFGELDTRPHVFKTQATYFLRQALMILGSLPASPQTFVYGKQLEQIMIALKSYEGSNVVTPDINQTFAKRIVALLNPHDVGTMIKHLIAAAGGLRLSPEAIVDQLQLITQLSRDTNLEVIAYEVFKRVALGFAFGLSQAQIVTALETSKFC